MKEDYISNEQNRKLLSKIRTGFMEEDRYITAIISIPRPSHDLFPLVEYEDKKGILLIKRKQNPAKGLIWCLGGDKKEDMLLENP